MLSGLAIAAALAAVGASAAQAKKPRKPLSCRSLPAPPLRSKIAVQHILGPGHPGPIAVTGQGIYVADIKTQVVTHLSLTGTLLEKFQLQDATVLNGLAADSQGDLYAGHYPHELSKYSPTGKMLWTRHLPRPLNGVFVIGRGRSQRVGVSDGSGGNATMFDLDGRPAAPIPVRGATFAPTRAGGLLGLANTNGGSYVHRFSSSGRETATFGDSRRDNDPMPLAAPLHFYQLGGAIDLPRGRILVTDTKQGVMLLNRQGLILGELPATEIDKDGLSERSQMALVDGYLYLETGPPWQNAQSLVRVRLSDLLDRTTHGETADPRLGIGAGLVMANTDLYVQPGHRVAVRAQFDPWWKRLARSLSLCWELRSANQLRDDLPGRSGVTPLSKLVALPAGRKLRIPAHLAPGAYQIDAYLTRHGKRTPVSHTRLIFTVAAGGMRLNVPGLPPAAGWGGPSPARGIALSDQLGLGIFRAQISWKVLLDKGLAAPLDLASYISQLQAAAAEARRSGGVLDVQVGQGGIEKQLVANGTWTSRVEELVRALEPYVHVWEAWNEPNATYGPARSYVDQVLKPFSQAVHAVDPTATVVGGSTVNVDLGYWKAIIAAGGLQWMDVAAVHPYTGHNRSWEENGTVPQLLQLRSMIDASGRQLPIWDTESAWWSNGPFNLLAQADNSARQIIWMKALGIAKWAYFIPEGGWGNDGVTFSAIQVGNYVKPAALAIMTADKILAGRPYRGEVSLGLPSAYALRFGPKEGHPASGSLLVAWTDGLRLPVTVRSSPGAVSLTRELGASRHERSRRLHLTLDSDPIYLVERGTLTIAPRQRFGRDLALGGTAWASSANPRNPASAAIDGIDGANGGGDLPGLPMWVSAPGDHHPRLQVTLPAPAITNRVIVGTHSVGNIVPGLRDYDVQVRASASSRWQTVGRVRDQFYDRHALIAFHPRTVAQIRVLVRSVDYGGYVDGGVKPSFWPTDHASLSNPASPWYGPAVVSELEAYAP